MHHLVTCDRNTGLQGFDTDLNRNRVPAREGDEHAFRVYSEREQTEEEAVGIDCDKLYHPVCNAPWCLVEWNHTQDFGPP